MKTGLTFIVIIFAAVLAAAAFQKNEKVQVDWEGEWYNATVLDVKDGKYLIHYEGYGSDTDEWVQGSRVRKGVKRAPRIPLAIAKVSSGLSLSGVETIWSCAYHPGGRYLAAGSDYGNVKFIDTAVPGIVSETDIGQCRVKALTFNSSGTLFAAGCDDGTLQIREFASKKLLSNIEGFSDITAAEFHPVLPRIAAAGALRENTGLNAVRVFDLNSGKMVLEPSPPVKHDAWYPVSLKYDRAGARLLTAVSNRGRGADISDAATGKRILRIPYSADLNEAVFSPDGTLIIAAAGNGKIPVWTGSGVLKYTASWHSDSARSVDVSPDGKFFAVGGRGSGPSLRLYSSADGKEIKSFGRDNPVSNMIRVSPDGKRIAAAYMVYGDAIVTTVLSEYKN